MAYQGEDFVERHGSRAAESTPPVARMLAQGVEVVAGTDDTRVASHDPWCPCRDSSPTAPWAAVSSPPSATAWTATPRCAFVNDVWSVNFASGRRLKWLTVADDFSHECVDIAVDYGTGGGYVTRLLDRAALFRGYPSTVRTDNGPAFTSRASWPGRRATACVTS
jgi:transposase InsO family protein